MPASVPDTDRRLEALERRLREYTAAEDRREDRAKHELEALVEGARRAFDAAIRDATKELVNRLAQLDQVLALNREQTELLKESAAERLRRRAREEILAEEKAQREVDAAALEAKRRSRQALLMVLVPAIVSVITALLAALFSHGGK